MSFEAKEYIDMEENYLFRNRTFKANLLNLPRRLQFYISENRQSQESWLESAFLEINEPGIHPSECHDVGLPSFVLDYARRNDAQTCEKFAKDAACSGDNIGEDEFDGGELFEWLDISEVFVLKKWPDGDIKAFIALHPCLTSRSVDTCQTVLGIYYDQNWIREGASWSNIVDFTKEAVYTLLILFAINLVKDINMGYTEVFVKVCPKSNPERLRLLQTVGFHVAACIPGAVLIRGNIEEDFLLAKNIGPPRLPRERSELIHLLDEWSLEDDIERKFDLPTLLSASFLPLEYKAGSNIIRVRQALKDDVTVMHDLFKKAGMSGSGFARDEFLTMGWFKSYLGKCFRFVHEMRSLDSDETQIVGCSLALQSGHTRTKRSRIAESAIVIDERFRGRGLGKVLILLEKFIIRRLGFQATVNDFFQNNLQMRATLAGLSDEPIDVTVGLIPRGAYTAAYGWENLVLCYSDLRHPALVRTLDSMMRNIVVTTPPSKL